MDTEKVQVRLSRGVVKHCWAIDEQQSENPKYGELWKKLSRAAGTRWSTVELEQWEAERLTREVSWQIQLALEWGEPVPSPLPRYLQENGQPLGLGY